MVKIPCGANNDSVGQIVFLKKLIDPVTLQGLDKFGSPKNWKTQRMIPPTGPVEQIMNVIVRGILYHLNLLKDDHSLLLHVFIIDERMEENVGKEIDGKRQIFVDHFGIKTGVFPSCKCIERSADGVNLFGDVESGSSLCPFEKKVFNEMGDPIFLRRFISGPRVYPYSDGG
jgi:hypothetical protein